MIDVEVAERFGAVLVGWAAVGPGGLQTSVAEKLGDKAKLKALPTLRRAALKIAAAVAVLLEIPPASGEQMVSLAQAWEEIERVIPREELTAAVEQLGELVPDDDGDDDAERRRELVKRYGSVTGSLGLLAQVQLGAVDVRQRVLAALYRLPEFVGRRRVLADELDETLVTGSWRRLVLANPELPAGVADHRA